MKKFPLILRCSVATLCAAVFAVPAASAATTDTFGGGGTPATSTKLRAGSGPIVILDDGNSILRLLDGVNDENNIYSYDLTDPGAFETITASFDFRVNSGTNGLADGIGFLLLPTSAFGTTGKGPEPTAEEPNVANAFGLGIDVYPNINNISTHWNGFQVNEMNPAPNVSFRDNAVFNRVQIQLQRVGNATNATVTLISNSLGAPGSEGAPYKIMETVIPNMLPYENRVQFNGRTGGENLRLDLDNVNVSYSNPFVGGLPVAPTGHLYQDFDSVGTTGYRAVQSSATTPTVSRPGPLIKAAGTGTSGAFMRIVNDAVEGQSNRIVFDRAFDGGASTIGEVLEFDLRFNSNDTPADGLGLVFLPTIDPTSGVASLSGDGIDANETPNIPGTLGIGFDVYNNGGGDVAPGVSLHFDGTQLVDVPLPAELGLGQFHKVQVIRQPVEGGLNVTVKATPNVNGVPGGQVTLIDNVFVAGARNHDYRVQFSGRTGGANADHDIDSIRSFQLSGTAKSHTHSDFSAATTHSDWKAYLFGTGAPPQIKNDQTPNGDYLRLIHDGSNGQLNSIAFEKQLDGAVAGAAGINAEFDFRMSGNEQSADGFSFMLIPTETYGNSGPGAVPPGFIAEDPNIAGVFGIGFDLYNGAGIEFNEVSAHWNGGTISTIELLNQLLVDFDAGVFHHLRLELRPQDSDVLLDLILTPDIFGTPGAPVTVFDDLLIPGMNLYDYRVEFAARSGGLNTNVDLDNIVAKTVVPEPGSAALLGVGGMLFSFRRQRRKGSV